MATIVKSEGGLLSTQTAVISLDLEQFELVVIKTSTTIVLPKGDAGGG